MSTFLQKIHKLIRVFNNITRYPGVIYFDAPPVLKLLGGITRPLPATHYSQASQDAVLFNTFRSQIERGLIPKVFIDVGANDPLLHSNSRFFESQLGFKVLAVDALSEMEASWRQHRPDAEFVCSAVGRWPGELEFDVVAAGGSASMLSSVAGASSKASGLMAQRRRVAVKTLSQIVGERGVEMAGIVSMDIEGYEFEALSGIDFTRFKSSIFLIENNADMGVGKNNVRDLMLRNGYVYFANIWQFDDIFVHRTMLSGEPLHN